MLLVLFEAVEKLQFFQTAVLHAESESEAIQILSRFLAKRGAQFVTLDTEETRAVSGDGDFPAGWLNLAEPGEGVAALGGRIWVDPPD